MKKSELRKLIKEEIHLLNEKIKAPKKLYKNYSMDFINDRDEFLKPVYNYINNNFDVEMDPYPKSDKQHLKIMGSYKIKTKKKEKEKFITIKWDSRYKSPNNFSGVIVIDVDNYGTSYLKDLKAVGDFLQKNGLKKR